MSLIEILAALALAIGIASLNLLRSRRGGIRNVTG